MEIILIMQMKVKVKAIAILTLIVKLSSLAWISRDVCRRME